MESSLKANMSIPDICKIFPDNTSFAFKIGKWEDLYFILEDPQKMGAYSIVRCLKISPDLRRPIAVQTRLKVLSSHNIISIKNQDYFIAVNSLIKELNNEKEKHHTILKTLKGYRFIID